MFLIYIFAATLSFGSIISNAISIKSTAPVADNFLILNPVVLSISISVPACVNVIVSLIPPKPGAISEDILIVAVVAIFIYLFKVIKMLLKFFLGEKEHNIFYLFHRTL